MGHRGRIRQAAGLALVLLIGAAVAVIIHRGSGDCPPVRALLEFDQAQRASLQDKTHIPAQGSLEEPTEPSQADYQAWMAGLRDRAVQVTQADLARKATRFADLAREVLDVNRRVGAEAATQQITDSTPPPAMAELTNTIEQRDDALESLESACPP